MHKKMSFRSSALVWHGDPLKRRRLPHQHARWFAMTLIYGNFYFSRQVLVSAPVAEQHLFICKPVPGQIQTISQAPSSWKRWLVPGMITSLACSLIRLNCWISELRI